MATKKRNKKGGNVSLDTATAEGFVQPVAQNLTALQDTAREKLAASQEEAGNQFSGLQDQAGNQFSGLQDKAKNFIPDLSVNGVLKKAFRLNDEQLEALGKANPSILQKAFLESLNEKKWALVTSALGFLPFIGQDFLAAKSVYKEATEVLSDSTKKIQAFLPKTSLSESEGIEMQDLNPTTAVTAGGARARNSNAILRRIEKSKKAFHNTNKGNATFGKGNATFGKGNATFGKTKKPSKTRKQKRMRRV